ncbi:MAG: hypothetical protein A2750_01380 [Candidatus Yanofskybacteria bacterium RIFCSPHIGHO2_01_FULL_45_42]|uniref:acetyl-CoA C-acetyltransferase n=2 Tax=Parcubacteria group TaxID=1794811 RepID=A0A1G1ZR82_9BACT|nr:MAG: hypothetical protein A2750_01380 [Candidatus Yanofskybacteria bacterium RIFCSPHIGHO2_01_FULL_45_42]OGY63889.1 MAG: hypothetical protein A3J53_03650 [Candidatus Harrisonbacteria bacterium RIFCSPHIGHO2_02_FULL_40_20]OGY66965.1 MAG: hypothetical protein A3I24_00610 [Candidatus Harrisonbacteria bacterium RIFCSPLOWO2_02_FULL_41_13b]
MNTVYVVGAARSYIFLVQRGKNGVANTSLISGLRPEVFGAQIRDGLFEAINISPELVELFRLGSLVSQKAENSMFHAPAKTIMRIGGRGCVSAVNAAIVEAACATGLVAIEEATEEIQLNRVDLALAGGIEMMSRHQDEVIQAVLRSPETGEMMWHLADKKTKALGISREEMDIYSFESYERTRQRKDKILFYIVPTYLSEDKRSVLNCDEGALKGYSLEIIRKVRPIQGCELITAAHASKYGDGAALALLASENAVKKYFLKPLARVLAIESWSEFNPYDFIVAPNTAIPKAVQKAGLTMDQIGVFFINEAFAPSPISFMKQFNVPRDKVNPEGGAIADAHPFGASGALRFVMLMDYLRRMQIRYGVLGICAAGGEASACVLELMP